jgi:hypothetical protein
MNQPVHPPLLCKSVFLRAIHKLACESSHLFLVTDSRQSVLQSLFNDNFLKSVGCLLMPAFIQQ